MSDVMGFTGPDYETQLHDEVSRLNAALDMREHRLVTERRLVANLEAQRATLRADLRRALDRIKELEGTKDAFS